MKFTLLLLTAVLILTLTACDHPSWANVKIVIKNKNGDEIEDSPYYCISAPRVGRVYYCAQPEGHVEEIEIEPGWKVQVWTLPKPMP